MRNDTLHKKPVDLESIKDDMQFAATTQQAYKLLHFGTLALADAEQQGIRVDIDQVQKNMDELTAKIEKETRRLHKTRFYKDWKEAMGSEPNIDSPKQLQTFLYQIKGIKPAKYTATGKKEVEEYGESTKGSTDEEALRQLNIPALEMMIRMRKWKKIRDTYLKRFQKEEVNGYIHPFFHLHTARTFRSCVSKGTKILAVRDFEKYPDGVPIEEIKKGDYVYCYDGALNPAIRKVKWSGKTGHRRVVRINYYSRGSKGSLEVTPEHRVRLVDGSYVQAKDLIGDFRKPNDSKKAPKIRALSCSRKEDFLYFTGHTHNGKGIKEHRLIYRELNGKLKDNELVHHKNGNHFDHRPENLVKMSTQEHSRYHALNATPEKKRRAIKALLDNRHKVKPSSGEEHPYSKNWSKFTCLRMIAELKGKPAKTNYDFDTFKKYLQKHGIDWKKVKLRYDKYGNYVWKTKLKKLSSKGISTVQKELGYEYYRLLELYDDYGISKSRKWANQFGEFVPGNHVITHIEWLNKEVDVYDLEIEDYNNFIANEICVHNSSSNPNFQNIPTRDDEAMKYTRSILYPRPGHQIMEVDYGALEVAIAAAYHKDPTMLSYLREGGDMHADVAEQIFMTSIDKSKPDDYFLRKATKNSFTFPQFYGDYYGNNAMDIAKWMKLPQNRKWKEGQGIEFRGGHISDHFISKGIKSLRDLTDHIEKIEYDFWNNRFPVYKQWRDDWWSQYQQYGYVDMLTGFRCRGLMGKNDVTNYPVQGCLTGDSKVLTPKGHVPIKELDDKLTKVWTGFKWAEAVGLYKGKWKRARITLDSGLVINCDTRHKLKNEKHEWVKFNNLSEGDYVALPTIPDEFQPSSNITWWFVIGFIVGDGYLAHRESSGRERKYVSITVGETKKHDLEKIRDYLESKGFKGYFPLEIKRKKFEGKKDKFQLVIEDKKFVKELEESGVIFGKTAHSKKIPHPLWEKPKIDQRDFLEGLMLSDGSRLEDQEGNLHMCNKELLQEVQKLAFPLGFDSNLCETNTGWLLRFSTRGKNKKPNRKIPFSVLDSVVDESQIKTKKSDNESITEKRLMKKGNNVSQYVGERIIRKYAPNEEIYRYDKIKSIEVFDYEEGTYTMSVNDELHQFTAEGVIHKNSAFHCLLWSFIELNKILKEDGWDSKVIGQIHDSILLDVHPDEVSELAPLIRKTTCEDLPKAWKWIIVPLDIEAEITPVDGSWAEKYDIKI